MRETSGKSFLENKEDWKYKRYTASHHFEKIKTPAGGYFCIFCGHAVPKRTKLKWYCDKKCLDDFNVRTGFFKYKIWDRDKKTCTICRKPGTEIDHIIPVVEGGGCCGLDNLRTLCTQCHREETNKLMQRRREAKKKTKTVVEFF